MSRLKAEKSIPLRRVSKASAVFFWNQARTGTLDVDRAAA
jgi:hypothetical protein